MEITNNLQGQTSLYTDVINTWNGTHHGRTENMLHSQVDYNNHNYVSKRKMKYITGKCGSGKSEYIYNFIQDNRTRNVLVVMPTKKLIDEFSTRFELDDLHIVVSDEGANVSKLPKIELLLTKGNGRVLFITDKMFYKIKIELLKDWKIFIDDCVDFCTVITRLKSRQDNMEAVYEKMFNIGNFIKLDQKPDNPINSTYYSYTLAQPENISDDLKAAYHEYCQLNVYHEKGIHKDSFDPRTDKLYVFGCYNLTRYENLDIIFLANCFEDTLLYKFYKNSFERLDVPLRSGADMDRLVINYFIDDNKGLSKEKMKDTVRSKLISEYINNNVTNYYWCKNKGVDFNLNGYEVSPNQRGVNSLQSYTSCVFMAAMNPSSDVLKHYFDIWGFTAADIKRQWELEQLYQFVYRGVIRDPDSTDIMNVYVFDRIALGESPRII